VTLCPAAPLSLEHLLFMTLARLLQTYPPRRILDISWSLLLEGNDQQIGHQRELQVDLPEFGIGR